MDRNWPPFIFLSRKLVPYGELSKLNEAENVNSRKAWGPTPALYRLYVYLEADIVKGRLDVWNVVLEALELFMYA